jgi:DNA polymerase-3 subunit delta'
MAGVLLPLVNGHATAKQYFERAIELGRLSHAYLLVGPEGAGKRRFARELGKVFHCETGVACGSCAPCLSIEHGNHPSVNVYGPAEGKHLIDIDTVRALCERTHYKSSGLEVAILERADLLNEPAANALLKTLEEPPGSALIILTAQSAGSLLSTIVSRCHRIHLNGSDEPPASLPPSASAALEDAVSPGFFAREDVKSWLGKALPDEESSRNALRSILGGLIDAWRTRLDAVGRELDDALQRLTVFLELRQDCDRSINPELILERLLRALRRGA